MIHTAVLDRPIAYDGSQIGSLWAYKECRLQGDSAVAFAGPCDIPFDNMVDLEDVQARSKIFSRSMLHFIVEHFESDLEKAVLRQRLLVVLLQEELQRRGAARLVRKGDDLFDGTAKLTISIATATPVSTKIHLGINIDKAGTPVETKGLNDYKIEPMELARTVLQRYAEECADIHAARCKVRGVN